MKRLSYYGMLKTLGRIGIDKEEYRGGIKYRLNTVVPMQENYKHFLVKALLCKILDDEGFRFISEWQINGRYVDVFCLDNFIAYEIETTKNKNFKKNLLNKMQKYSDAMGTYDKFMGIGGNCVSNFQEENICVIFVKDLPRDFDGMIKRLKEIIKEKLADEEHDDLEEQG